VPAKGNPTIVAASADVIMTASAMEMANRTGYPLTGLSKGSLANTSDVTVIAHGIKGTNNIEVGGRSLTPKQFAREMYDAGWRGGTMRLAICTSCTGGPSVAEEVANEFAKLGVETAIIAPAGVGKVSELGGVHGLPQGPRTLGVLEVDRDAVAHVDRADLAIHQDGLRRQGRARNAHDRHRSRHDGPSRPSRRRATR